MSDEQASLLTVSHSSSQNKMSSNSLTIKAGQASGWNENPYAAIETADWLTDCRGVKPHSTLTTPIGLLPGNASPAMDLSWCFSVALHHWNRDVS